MTRDYAQKKRTPKKRRSNAVKRKKTGFPTAAVLIVGAIVGGFVSFLFYLKWIPSLESNGETVAKQNPPKANKEQAQRPAEPDVPKYTFHERLEEKEVIIPEEDLQRAGQRVSMEYLMPCGAFRESQRAETLKAQIALLGFESQILPVTSKQETWYRVQLGPYASKRQAESIRHRLRENSVENCVINGRRL